MQYREVSAILLVILLVLGRCTLTEIEWINCESQNELLKFIREKASARKLRLFSFAVVRGEWKWLKIRNRCAVEMAERFADGQATWAEMEKATDGAFATRRTWGER
jgi:hypothetical protein